MAKKARLKIFHKMLFLLLIIIVAVGEVYSIVRMNKAYEDMHKSMGLALMSENLDKNTNTFIGLTYGYLLIESESESKLFLLKWENALYQLNDSLNMIKDEKIDPYQVFLIEKYVKISQEAAYGLINSHQTNMSSEQQRLNLAVIKDAQERIDASVILIHKNVDIISSEATANFDKSQRMSLIIFLVTILMSILIALFLSKGISKPILELVDITEKVSKGNLDVSASVNSSDETMILSDSFNKMISDLKKSRGQIEEYNKNLEKKISERTKELNKRDDELITRDRELRDINKKLQTLDTQKDEFISLTAHELKTPLTSIRGFTQLLQDESVLSDKEQRNHYIDLINKNTDRLYTLVLDVVDSSRLSLGKLKLNVTDIDTNKLFMDIKENMSIVITTKGLIPDFFVEPNISFIRGDYERVMQVLHNLISNSVKFTEKGSISLKVYHDGDFVKFEVKDTGQGIPKENFNSIFSRFYQVDSSPTRKIGGSGLGLSICKGLVENMGGKIWFDSELGKGSTFYFTLPIIKNNA